MISALEKNAAGDDGAAGDVAIPRGSVKPSLVR